MRPFRLLLIEDNKARIGRFRAWLPPSTVLVVATSGGQAMGVLNRAEAGEYAGLLLDHDLHEQLKPIPGLGLSGRDMVDVIIRRFERSVSILVHSRNPGGASTMVRMLDQAGFWVTQVPMHELTRDAFCEWVEDLREEWQERWAD